MYSQVTLYSPKVVSGVSALVAASSLSLLSATGTLFAIFLTTTRRTSSSNVNSSTSTSTPSSSFIRSPLGGYLISLLFAELIQSAASLLSITWLIHHGVFPSHICSFQAAIKNAGNVATAIWSFIIASHTFALLFLKLRIPYWVFWATILGGWGLVGFVVLLGPTAIQTVARGPFWGVSGYWCWITPAYTVEQFAMEYLFMLITSVTSLVLYMLIFLHLRGNILYGSQSWYRLSFHRTSSPWARNTSLADPQIEKVGKSMLLYPLCYVALVLPIAICRWRASFGVAVPFEWTITADFIFLCSGVVNALLYCLTRRVPVSAPRLPSFLAYNWKGNNSGGGGDDIRRNERFQVGGATSIRSIDPEATLIDANDMVSDEMGGTRDYAYGLGGDIEKAKMMGSENGRVVDVQVDNDALQAMSGLPTIPPLIHVPPHVLPHTTPKAISPPLTLAAAIKADMSNPESITPMPTPLGPAPARRSLPTAPTAAALAAALLRQTYKSPGSKTVPTPVPSTPATTFGIPPELSTHGLTRNPATRETHSEFDPCVGSRPVSWAASQMGSGDPRYALSQTDWTLSQPLPCDANAAAGRRSAFRISIDAHTQSPSSPEGPRSASTIAPYPDNHLFSPGSESADFVSSPSMIPSYMPVSPDGVDADVESGLDRNVNVGRRLSSGTFGPPTKRRMRASPSPTYSQDYTVSPDTSAPVSPVSESARATANSHPAHSGARDQLFSHSLSMRSNSDAVSVSSSKTFDSSRPPRHRVDVPRPHPFSYIGVGAVDVGVSDEGSGYE